MREESGLEIRFSFADGEEISPAVQPAELILKSEADTLADTLYMRYAAERRLFEKEPSGARLFYDGAVIFDGIADEHRMKSESGTFTETFSLRSRAALLSDNEAAPAELRMPSLRLLERLFLEPLGLKAAGGDRRPADGILTVEKGMSAWKVISEFSERYLNCTPYADTSGNIHFEPYVPKRTELKKITAREVILRPCERLSRVTVQNAQTGAYNAEYHDPSAPLPRVRYISVYEKTAPTALLRESRRKAEKVKITCAAYIDGVPGDTAVLAGEGEKRLISKRFSMRGGNIKTELIFEPCV